MYVFGKFTVIGISYYKPLNITVNGMLASLAISPLTRARIMKVHNLSSGVNCKSAMSQATVVRLATVEHVPQSVAWIWYCLGQEVATGSQVNVSRAVELAPDMLTVIFSGGGWRSKSLKHNKLMSCIHVFIRLRRIYHTFDYEITNAEVCYNFFIAMSVACCTEVCSIITLLGFMNH